MRDEEYVYRQEIKEKAITARSSHNARSARRHGCHLPSDYLTKKELQAMNGPNYKIKLNEPMTWEAFKAVPKDLQETYVQNILNKYAVGPAAFAKMFGISTQYCGTYLHELGIRFAGRANPKETARFLSDYSSAPKAEEPKAEEAPPADKKNTTLERIALTFSGAFSPEEIAQRLSGFFLPGQEVTVSVEVIAR